MSAWAFIMAGFSVAIFLSIMVFMARTYSPNLARNVKYAERAAVTHYELAQIQLRHPEIVKVARQDRYPLYWLLHLGAIGYVSAVLSGSPLTSNVLSLGSSARYTMATCFLVGSTLVLIGVAMGLKVGRRTIAPRICDHPTYSVLGDDIVLPYRLEMAGMGAMMVSSGIYSWTSFHSTSASLGGWLTLVITIGCAMTIPIFYRAVKDFEKWDNVLITEAQSRIEGAGGSNERFGDGAGHLGTGDGDVG